MAKGYQKVIISGNLGKDPVFKYMAHGQGVLNFSVAVNEAWKDKTGRKHERVEWFNCEAWGKLAEAVHPYMGKGQLVLVEGRMKTHSWQDKDTGATRYATTLVVSDLSLQSFIEKREGGAGIFGEGGESPTSGEPDAPGPGEFTEDDIPF